MSIKKISKKYKNSSTAIKINSFIKDQVKIKKKN